MPVERRYLSATLKHGSIYGLGIVLSRLIGLVMIPVYTRVLTPTDYGIMEILSMTTDVIAMVTGLGLTWAVNRYYYYYDDPRDKQAVVSTAAIGLVALFSLAVAGTLPFAAPLSALLLGTSEHAALVRLALVSFLLSSLLEIPMVYLRAKQASAQVVLAGLARLVLALVLNIALVVVLRMEVAGVLYSSIGASTVVGGFFMIVTLRETGVRVSLRIGRQLIRYGAPLVAWSLGSFVLHYSDRYFLRGYDTIANVGLYSLAYRFAMLVSLFIASPFGQIWEPKALEIHKNEGPNASSVFRGVLSYYNVVLVGCALGIALFSGDVIRLMADAEFHEANRPIPLLCLAMIFFNYRHISQIGAMIRERSELIAYSTCVAAGTVLLLNFLLIPRFGVMGAAWATVGAFGTEYLIMSALSRRIYPFQYPLWALLRPLLLAVAVYTVVTALMPPGPSLSVSLLGRAAAFLAFIALLALTRTLSVDQRTLFLRGIRNPLQELRAIWGS